MQDTASTRYLLNRRRRGEPNGSNPFAFGFDGVDDYISSNATIGRTGYDMNVSGNVTTGSDSDGNYFWINGNRDHTAGTGTLANLTSTTTLTYTQNTSFTLSTKFKITSTQPNNATGIFGYNYGASIFLENNDLSLGMKCRIREGASFQDVLMGAYVLDTAYSIHLVYDSATQKMFCYRDGVLVNTGGTSIAFSFTDNGTYHIGDDAIGGGNKSSADKKVYHACIRNKALTQAEIDADIALGNTTKQDPSIVAYYVPENLQYNTQYTGSPKDLSIAPRSLSGTSSVTADTTVAPDGTTTADTLQITGTATQGIDNPNLTITGSTIASRTFIVKAFVKVSAGTALFRLKMTHRGVADYFSSDLTATTSRQEFTFTQTFTSSTSGTGIISGIVNSTGVTNPLLQVRNVRCYLVNETLRDESPNIGGFIGRKTQKVLSCRYKPNADFADASDAGCLISQPRAYLQDRGPLHNAIMRYDNRIGARTSFISLGSLYRSKTHILGLQYRTGSARATKLYINGTLLDSDNHSVDAPTGSVNTVMRNGRKGSTYFSGNIRDPRIYTFTGSFTDADALAIYNGGEPTSAGVTKHLHYRPPVGEVGTTTQDQSSNDRDGTLNGGVTRVYL